MFQINGLFQAYFKGENLLPRGQERWSKVCFDTPPRPIIQPQPEKLSRSKFNTPDDLAAFSQKFDEGVKKVFSNDRVAQCVKFGRPRDNDPEFGIKAGMLMLDG